MRTGESGNSSEKISVSGNSGISGYSWTGESGQLERDRVGMFDFDEDGVTKSFCIGLMEAFREGRGTSGGPAGISNNLFIIEFLVWLGVLVLSGV